MTHPFRVRAHYAFGHWHAELTQHSDWLSLHRKWEEEEKKWEKWEIVGVASVMQMTGKAHLTGKSINITLSTDKINIALS